MLSALLAGMALAGAFDDRSDLAAAAKKIVDAESYAYKTKADAESSAGPPSTMESEGAFQRSAGLYVLMKMQGQEVVGYRKGEKTILKGPDGVWKAPTNRLKLPTPQTRAPHEDIADFEKKLKDVRKAGKKEAFDGEDCAVYEGSLTEEGVQQLMPNSKALYQAEITATAKAWVDPSGTLRKVRYEAKVKAKVQETDLRLTIVRVTEFSAIGKSKVEIPAEVLKMMENP